jgi:COP9 signalosome complex subunit 6
MDTTEVNGSKSSVMAPSSAAPSVIVALHPLVIMNISEHWTRIRAQLGKSAQVYGALLGRQKGRNIELCTSFEIKMNPVANEAAEEDIDLEYLNTNIAQCKFRTTLTCVWFKLHWSFLFVSKVKQVFADLDFLGWYTTGGVPSERDIFLHKQICTINESPVLLKLDPFGKHTDLPVCVYESVIDIVQSQEVKMLFIELEYTLATEEAERIGVDHIAKHTSNAAMVQSVVSDHLNAQYSAITLLNNRIRVIYDYVKMVRDDKGVKRNHEILREIQSLCNRLPVMNSPDFYKEFYTVNTFCKLLILYCNSTTTYSYLSFIMTWVGLLT